VIFIGNPSPPVRKHSQKCHIITKNLFINLFFGTGLFTDPLPRAKPDREGLVEQDRNNTITYYRYIYTLEEQKVTCCKIFPYFQKPNEEMARDCENNY